MNSGKDILDTKLFIESAKAIEAKIKNHPKENNNVSQQVEGIKREIENIIQSLNHTTQDSYHHYSHLPFSNINIVLATATMEDLENIFFKLVDINKLSLSVNVFALYSFVSQSLISLRDKQNMLITWEKFIYYLDYDNTLSLMNTSSNNDIKTKAINYFSTLEGIDRYNFRKNNSVLSEHDKNAQSLIQVFTLNNQNNININEKITLIMNDSLAHKELAQDYLPHVISSIRYEETPTLHQKKEIHQLIENYKKMSQTPYSLYYQIIDSIIYHDENTFFKLIDSYVSYYLYKEKREVNEILNLQDKILLFYTPYFHEFFDQDNTVEHFSIIALLLKYYHKSLFLSFFEHYELSINIPLRFETIEKEDDIEDEEDEYIVKNNYLHLLEYCSNKGYSYVIRDLTSHYSAEALFMPFKQKIIEHDKVYHYDSMFLSSLDNISHYDISYFIDKGFIHENTNHLITSEDSVEINSIFFYLLQHNHYHAFNKLYYKAKNKDVTFSLTSLFSKEMEQDLLQFYLYWCHIYDTAIFNEDVLDIFYQERFNLLKGENNTLTLIKRFSLKQITQLMSKLEELLPEDYKLSLLKNEDTKELIVETPATTTQNLIEWFNREKLQKHLSKVSQEKDNAGHTDYIKHMLLNDNHIKPNLILEDDSFFNVLHKDFPNFSEVIKFYKGQFRLKKLTNKIRIQPILLLGEPGIGKTYFAKTLAKYFNTGYTFLDMGSITANWILSGNNGTWKNAKQGKILDAMMNSKTVNPIVLMDELDKAKAERYDPTVVLYQLLEEINAVEFTDEFVDFSFNASGIIYIACANTIGHMSEPLLSRFKVFNVPSPTTTQLETIIANIYRESIKDTQLFNLELPHESIAILKQFSLRNITNMIDDAISASLLNMEEVEISTMIEEQKTLTLDRSYFTAPIIKNSLGF